MAAAGSVKETGSFSFVNSNPDTVRRYSGSFVELGYKPGMRLYVSGIDAPNEDLSFKIETVTDRLLTLIAADVVTTSTFATVTLTADYSIELGVTAATGDTFCYELTSIPTGSRLRLGFLTDPLKSSVPTPLSSAQVEQLASLDANVFHDEFTPDVAGEYTIRVYEFRRFDVIPSYPGDPAGDRRFALVATQSTTVHVGGETLLRIVTERGDGGDLRLQVNDETVRSASIINTTSELARTAALQSAVTTPLAALVGVTVPLLGTLLQAGANNLRTQYNVHRAAVGGIHVTGDTTNVVELGAAASQDGAIRLINEIRDELVDHLLNSTDAGGAFWHASGSDDLANVPVVGAATTLAAATVLLYDLRERVYERHRILEPLHGVADAVNALTAPLPLDDLVVAYLDELVSANPAVIAREPEGLTDAAHLYGFVSSPPEITPSDISPPKI